MVEQVLVGIGFTLVCVAAILMLAGYGVLIHQALRSAERREALRRIWKTQDYRTLHQHAGRLIYTGAFVGCVGCLLLVAGGLLVTRTG